MSNLFTHSVGFSFPYPWNLGTWAIFYSLDPCTGAGCIFPIACTNAANAWAIILFYFPSEGLLSPFPSFIFWFGGGEEDWLSGWFDGWFKGLFPWSLSLLSSSLSSDDSSGELLLLIRYLVWYLGSFSLNVLDGWAVMICPKVTFLFADSLFLRTL